MKHAALPWSGHIAITDRQVTPIVPTREDGRPWKEGCPAARVRNETLRATQPHGRAFWKRRTDTAPEIGSRARRREAFGERILARDPDRQTAEIHIRGSLINRFNALGTAEILGVA